MKQDKLLNCIRYARFLLKYAIDYIDGNLYAKSKLNELDDYLLGLYIDIRTEDTILEKFLTLHPNFAKKDGTLSKQKKDVKMYDEFKKKEGEL
jgi:hypothetical protein